MTTRTRTAHVRAETAHRSTRRRARGRFVLAASAALMLPAAPAHALELFGMTLFGSKKTEENGVTDPRPYTLDFRVESGDPDLVKAVQAASTLYAQKDDPPAGASGLVARAEGDYQRILAALYARGHYGGTIVIEVAGRQPDALPPDAALPDPAPVSVRVDPGPLFRFGRIDIEGRAPAGSEEVEDIPTPAELGLATGEPALSGAIVRAEARLVEAWHQLGHPKADISVRDIVADHATNLVDVRIVVDAGGRAAFGPVAVTGTERMDPTFVAYMTGIPEGHEYDPAEVERARARLQRLEVFRAVSVTEAERIGADGLLPLTFNVAERKPRVFGVGGSLSTVDGASLETYWTHRNLFGRAERLRLEARVSGIGGTDYETFDYYAGAHFTKPGILSPNTDLFSRVQGLRDYTETYDERSVSGRVGLAHRFTPRISGDAAIDLERSRIEDALGEEDFLVLGLPSNLTFDSRDSEIDPTRGVRATLYAEPFHDFEHANSVLVSRASVSTYRAFDEAGRYVLAGRLAAGSILGAELAEIPIDRLFLAGGGGSVRGYAYRSIGVTLPNGDVIGGRSILEGSLELRAKVTDTIGIVPFVDAAMVDEDVIPDFSQDLRVGVGLGLRYYTSLGPIRLDVATPLDPGPNDSAVAFYVGIGQAF